MDENTLPQRFFIIRPFMKGDETACKQIIGESIMSSMGRTFASALFRETTFQLMIFMSAILFIIVGIPFHYCVISVPLTILGLYFVVWSSLLMKSLEAQHEMSLIKQQYQQTDKTNFWIAEYYGPMIDFDPKAHISRLCTEDSSDQWYEKKTCCHRATEQSMSFLLWERIFFSWNLYYWMPSRRAWILDGQRVWIGTTVPQASDRQFSSLHKIPLSQRSVALKICLECLRDDE